MKRPRLPALALLAASLAGAVASCSRETPRRPRLVLLYAVCTLSKDFLSPYNAAVAYTPGLEALARRAVVFTRHVTESGQSGISYASLYSGSQAPHHGVYRHPTRLSDDLYLISEAYADSGYQTFFWNVHKLAGTRLNYAQGVATENTAHSPLTLQRRRFRRLLDELRADAGARAFVTTNFSTTHALYGTAYLESFLEQYPSEAEGIPEEDVRRCLGASRPAGCNELYSANAASFQYDLGRTIERFALGSDDVLRIARLEELLYKANVCWLDKLFGDVVREIEARDLLDETLIVFTADHGEVLYRDNALFNWTHGQALAPEVLSVPLIVFAPGLAGRAGTYEGVSRSIDVFPTLLGLSGLPVPADRGIEGVDLSPALAGRRAPPDLLAFSHTTIPMDGSEESEGYAETLRGSLFPEETVGSVWVAVRQRDSVFKWRHLGNEVWGFEVFDLARDPTERRNLYDPGDPLHRDMARRLVAYKELLVGSYAAEREDAVSQDEKRRLLKSLGYL